MLFKTKVLVVAQDKRRVGKITTAVARELINTRSAKVIHNRPLVLEFTPGKKPGVVSNKPIAQPKINALKNIVDMANKFVSKRQQHIENILLVIDGSKLYVEATDLGSHFSGHIEAGSKYRFSHDEGISSVCVSPERLRKLLPLTEGIIDIHIQKKEDVLGVRIGEFFLEGESADGFPMVLKKRGMSFNATNIANKLNFVGLALSTMNTRATLCGIYFDFKNNNLVGSDGSRLHIVPLNEGSKQKKVDAHTIVPPNILTVGRYLNGNIELAEDGKKENQHTVFELNVPGCIHCHVTFQSIEGAYPNYPDVVPVGYKNKFITRTDDIIPCLRKVQAHVGNDYRVALVEFGAETKISAKTYSTTSKDACAYSAIIKGNYTGVPYKELVNPDFLLDCVQALPTGEIEINLADKAGNEKGWLIKEQHGFVTVIMPIGAPN